MFVSKRASPRLIARRRTRCRVVLAVVAVAASHPSSFEISASTKRRAAMIIKGSVLRGATFALALGGSLMAQGAGAGGAFTMTNAADDNSIVVFDRNAQGLLTKTAVVATGGNGSGGGH